ncbi:DNA topoisomerase [Streptococcus dysgalactiae]|uniref:DNA topoisomerase n=1 Tax=Streptococcus dysgalactiae TaxID=1334 RepID=UPI0010CAC2D4|nr:DNA topoisomerase [Streptococcus dysgalactiae]VTS16030.1 DNA topoisomerase [Streptococcus dysgalactiae subsp. equisimilis]
MKYLILAEKPDQAQKYAHALGQVTNEKGVWKVKTKLLDGQLTIVSAVGHLVEIKNPYQNYENWDLANLPAFPEAFEYEVKANKKKQFNLIKREVNQADCIIIGTDADREGESIAYLILRLIPNALKKVKYRLWVNSLTDAGIIKSFKKLRPAQETRQYAEEAEARAKSDWLVGFNLSPWTSLKLQEMGYLGEKEKQFSVGRVQTPIVSLIVENDLSIDSFKSRPFWKIELVDDVGTIFKNKTKFETLEGAQEAINTIERQSVVLAIHRENKSVSAPNLHHLTSLQSEMSKKYHFDSAYTLELAQKLYQKGVTSYPRTDHKLITPNEFDVLVKYLEDYKRVLSIDADLSNIQPRKKYVQDKEMEHYAIIPTENTADVVFLEGDEKILYTEILKRTLLMFAPDYRYQATEVTLDNNGHTFSAKGNVMTSEGWTMIEGKENKDSVLPVYQEGSRIATEAQIKEDKTKPPARMTESSLLDDVLPKYNLGTPATRAGIIKTIIDRDYITRDKKTGQLFPTDRGKMLVLFLDNLEVMYTNPETTGKWETALQLIGQGQKSKEWFIEQTKKAITAQLEKGAS